MPEQHMLIKADIDSPLLFRTTQKSIYESTIKTGELWLRSDEYYRKVEDKVRNDNMEGVNGCRTTFPLVMQAGDGPQIHYSGSGMIGQQIVPHYILSMHGTSISRKQLRRFGGYTFGITNLKKLGDELFACASQQIKCARWRGGQVSYRYTSLALAHSIAGSAPLQISETPPVFLSPIDTDVLAKNPIKPFIEQDEWRLVIFTDGYLNDNPDKELRLKVDPTNFYPYSSR